MRGNDSEALRGRRKKNRNLEHQESEKITTKMNKKEKVQD